MVYSQRLLLGSLASLLLYSCSSGGDSMSLTVLRDTDRDGLPDTLEQRLGSDPRDADAPYPEGAEDDHTADGPGRDAIPDGLERHLLAADAAAPITAATDSDSDQVPDYLEVASGLDPRNPDDPKRNGTSDGEDVGGPAFDGISDGLESYLLRRGARIPLTSDSDSDGDGIADVLEARSGSDPFDALDPPYGRAFDLDHDQVPDWLELRDGSDLLLADFPSFDGADDDDGGTLGPDGDGVTDGLEGWLVHNGAAAPATTASDSDGDGAPDVAEVRAGSDPFEPDSPLAGGARDEDGDGLSDALERILLRKGARTASPTSDSDGDRVPDFVELLSGSDPFARGDPSLFTHFDLDRDGLFDFLEHELGSDVLDPDSPRAFGALDVDDAAGPSRDPLSDAMESLLTARGASAPATTYTDTDGDGIPDFVELRWVSDALDPDSPVPGGAHDANDATGPAGDGITDGAEGVLIALGAEGLLDASTGSDADDIPDSIELVTGSNWLDAESPRPGASPDIDGDGAPDYLELALGSDVRSADDPVPAGAGDSDEDGLSDALEELLRRSGTSEPVAPRSDSDGDGLYDYLEVRLASARHDPDRPLANGGADVNERSGPSGDGLSDALEHYLIQSGAALPVRTRSDTDGDAVPDYLELLLALDAFDSSSPLEGGNGDEDSDGVSGALELVLARLGAPAPVDGRTDSDRDGAPDHLEVFAGSHPFDPRSPVPAGGQDSDGDGLSNALESVLIALGARAPVTPRSDLDADGIPDFYEVRSGTNPLRGDHPLVDGGADVIAATGPRDTISDALEGLLVSQGALAPVTRGSDTDGDGAPDHLEVPAGSGPMDGDSPLAAGAGDSDGDRLTDALEAVLTSLGATPPLDARTDTDGDGAPDQFEVLTSAHPIDGDVPVANGSSSAFDVNASTGPNGDGLSDALEQLLIAIGCTPPIGTQSDTDLDGLPDAFEARSGTNPLDGDSPLAGGGADANDETGPGGDLLSDALEAFLIAHGARGPVTTATDTDGDGVPDFYEVFKGSDPFDERDEIAPGTPPLALEVSMSGIDFEGRELRGHYRYLDAQFDPEGATVFRWLRDELVIPGAESQVHVLSAEDLGHTLSFEVTPISRFAYPPDTAAGEAQRADRIVPVPVFPHGTGGPGGVSTSDGRHELRLWLRADQGIATSVFDVTSWEDRSGFGNHAEQVSPVRLPDLVGGVGPRATRAVRFDGASHLRLPRPVEDDFTLFVLCATTSTVANPSWWLSPAILGGEVPPPCTSDYHLGINGGRPLFVVEDLALTTTDTISEGGPHSLMASRALASGELRLSVDGSEQGTALSSSSSLTCAETLLLGSSTEREGFWSGDLFELCAFARVLGAVERNLIENYLAGRFGNVPARSLYAARATHGGDVAGIGRETSLDLLEEAEGPGILRISAPSALSDGDYLVWGTDRPLDYTLSSDAPAPLSTRLRRTWSATLTDGGQGDGVGTVSVRFRVKGLFLTERVEDFALLFDDDGIFVDARVEVPRAEYDRALGTIEFRGVTLGPERFFALAVKPL